MQRFMVLIVVLASLVAARGLAEEFQRCGFPTVDTRELGDVEAVLRAYARVDEKEAAVLNITVPVVFHNLQLPNGKGQLSDRQINEQLAVLNKAYKKVGIRFLLGGVNDVVAKQWFKKCEIYKPNGKLKGKFKKMASALAADPRQYVNVYTCKTKSDIAGVATPAYPIPGLWPGLDEGSPFHAVMVHYETFPFGDMWLYNKGGTLTHELGHYFGLWHTFHPWPYDDGCTPPGDEVGDTPYESYPALEAVPFLNCARGRDTCPSQPGNDPVTNIMDYGADKCAKKFTKGQRKRVQATIEAYRPSLVQ